MSPQFLIDAIVQQTVVFIAHLATAGGVRVPLAQIADQVFVELSDALSQQGVSKKVIADMFGMALRTYHRRVQAARQSNTEAGQSVWGAVYQYVCQHEPISGAAIQQRFVHDDPDVVAGVLTDLTNSGLVYRAGRGAQARYRAASPDDLSDVGSASAADVDWMIWLAVYRNGPVDEAEVARATRLPVETCRGALERLVDDRRVDAALDEQRCLYSSRRLEVPIGETRGWEVAVLDHFQAVVTAVSLKLQGGVEGNPADWIGGSTWSLDVWRGHPLFDEATGTLSRLRRELEDLRERVDQESKRLQMPSEVERVVVYLGQYVRAQVTAPAHVQLGENDPSSSR